LFIDQAFSYRLESAEWLPSVEWIDALARDRVDLGAEREMVAGGWMMYAGPGGWCSSTEACAARWISAR